MNTKNSHIIIGLVSGLSMAITVLALYLTKAYEIDALQLIAYLPFLAGVIVNALYLGKNRGGEASFGELFTSCFKASMVISLIFVLYTFITFYAFPDIKLRDLAYMAAQKGKSSGITDKQIDQAIEQMKKNYQTGMISRIIFASLVAGALFSVIGASISKLIFRAR